MHTALVSNTVLLVAASIIIAAPVKGVPTDACTLLSRASIRTQTGEQVASTKATSRASRDVLQSQCFYALPTFTNSVSVTLISPAGASRDGARKMWERWFHPAEDHKSDGQPASEEEEAAGKASPVTGVGDEAFWVRSFVGTLYVRKGNRFLRISLGGKMNDQERQARAKALAASALRRLP
ncbi:MAG TPA: hypothetical protein VKR61_06150 [Bryobacteraceae bacterium]|nr:hypothetical protein [Bryobacteraceae bacterium]